MLFFNENLLIVANAMTDVEGVVDEVVVGEGDALGVSRRTRGELKTHTEGDFYTSAKHLQTPLMMYCNGTHRGS